MEKEKVKPKLRESKSETHDAAARCRAVLSVWMESRKPTEVCREMGIKWMTLSYWQKRAMEGMLQALTPRAPLAQGRALPPRLLAILSRQEELLKARLMEPASGRLSRRLQRIQEHRQEPEAATQAAKS